VRRGEVSSEVGAEGTEAERSLDDGALLFWDGAEEEEHLSHGDPSGVQIMQRTGITISLLGRFTMGSGFGVAGNSSTVS